MILKTAKDYYKNYKKTLQERAKNQYRKLSEDDKNIKREYGRKRYKYTFKENKNTL